MIISINVCDYCGNQTELQSSDSVSDSGICVELTILPACKSKNVRFSPDDKKTFCDMDCFLEFLKTSFDKHGRKKMLER